MTQSEEMQFDFARQVIEDLEAKIEQQKQLIHELNSKLYNYETDKCRRDNYGR